MNLSSIMRKTTDDILNANLDLIRAKINDEISPEIRLKAEKLADIVNVANPILIEEIVKSAELMNVSTRVFIFRRKQNNTE